MKTTVIRIILSLGLLVGVYSETGWFTTTALGLAMAGIECNTKLISIIKTKQKVTDMIDGILQKHRD